MNKNVYCIKSKLSRSLVILALALFVPLMAAAQMKKVTGVITDETGEPIIGALAKVVGTTLGAATDAEGKYSIELPSGQDMIEYSFLGYETQTIAVGNKLLINVQLQPKSFDMDEVVVIGYGSLQKKDLTGSVSNINSKDFNSGSISSPEQLINGKVSGVQIMSNSGSPSAGSTIRIRGGASLNASNDPLIVLDGVPLETGGISGNTGNFLSLINPADIESMTILKDASSTAIYGSRASNGVIIINTKKGSGDKLKISANAVMSTQTTTSMVDVLSRDQFYNLVNTRGTSAQKALLGNSNTDWNDEIYRAAFGLDANLSIMGRIAPTVPFRVSLGFYDQNGLLKRDYAKRITNNISVSPSFFNDDLKINLNVKSSLNFNRFAQADAVWRAATSNPTIPVYSGNDSYGGYNEALDATGKPVNGGTPNPLGLIEQNDSKSTVKRMIANADADYKLPFLPELKFHATLGYDYAEGKGSVFIPVHAAEFATSNGRDYEYGPEKNINRLLTAYFNYNKDIKSIKSTVDATLGYDHQFWKSTRASYSELNTLGDIQTIYAPKDQRHALISYYARLNYTYDSRYMLTGTIRRDGTSRFHKDHRWGTFPSVALAWRLTEESFMKGVDVLSNLKLRASFGITGQQDGIGNYNYLPVYTLSQEGAQAQFGNGWSYTYRPSAYVEDLKWETTSSWNFGLDYGFLGERINGSVDFYTRKTKDLLATVPAAAGTNFNKTITTNVGNVDSQGIEFTLNAIPIETKDYTWNISYNMTWQKLKVKNLSLVKGSAITNTLVGPVVDRTHQLQVLTEGYAPYMFYVYHQLYDEATGKPIEGAYADLDGNGEINSEDLYRYHSPAPDLIFGLSTSFRYDRWTLGTSLRANVGNYVYNGIAMNTGAWSTMSFNAYQLNNLSSSYLKTGFQNRQYLSDYYVENASFLKMDNITLNYNVGRIKDWFNLNLGAVVQNVFCITKYSGADPEVPNGMDVGFYPRPRTFSINVGLDF